MYIKPTRSYYTPSGEQRAARGLFLLLVQDKEKPCNAENTRAIVRKVALRQCGHWMMGSCRIKGEEILISGAYGSDGLPKSVSSRVFAEAIPLPAELYEAWNKGGGWNGSGSEATAMRVWALANLDKLYKPNAPKYVAWMTAADGGFLLGGVKTHRSIGFTSRADAEQWLAGCIETNEGAGRKVAASGIIEQRRKLR